MGAGRRPSRRLVALLTTVALLVLGLTGALMFARPTFWLLDHARHYYPNVLYYVRTDAPLFALTIDDAPHPDVTPGILDVLRRHGVRATFFIIGEHAARYPALIDSIRANGHELGNHFYTDRESAALGRVEAEDELRRTDHLIAGGHPPRWLRPGHGVVDATIEELSREYGYRLVLATTYPLDIGIPSFVTRWQFLANARPGAILVLHDGGPDRRDTIDILDSVLPVIAKRGIRVTTLSELVDRAGKGAAAPDGPSRD